MPKCPKCKAIIEPGSKLCSECGQFTEEPILAENGDMATKVNQSKQDPVTIVLDVVKNYWMLIVTGIIILIMHQFALAYWWDNWNRDQSYYSHGPLVPVIVAFMIWASRKHLAQIKVQPSWIGLLLILPSIPLYIFARWSSSNSIMAVTFFAFIFGSVLLLLGSRMTRLLLFPLLYLSFMVPLPATILDETTGKVQMASTIIATKTLQLSGYKVVRNGSEINNEGYYTDLPERLIVGAPCSGFKLLISLLAFTCFFVYMINDPSRKVSDITPFRQLRAVMPSSLRFITMGLWDSISWKQLVLVLFSFPLSLAINSLRIVMIGYAGIWTQSGDAMHKFHDYSGYIGLIVCFVILFCIAKLIKADAFGISEPSIDPSLAAASNSLPISKAMGRGNRGTVLLSILGLVLVSNFFIHTLNATARGHLTRADFPETVGSWMGRDLPIDDTVKEVLNTADLLSKSYMNVGSDRQIGLFVEAAKDTFSFHNPHSCLPGSGNIITHEKVITLNITDPKPMKIRATVLQTSSDAGSGIVLHWYMCGSESYPNTAAVRQRVRVVQLQDFANVLKHLSKRSEIEKSIDNRQWYWYRFSTDTWGDGKMDQKLLEDFAREFIANRKHFGE